MNISDINLKLFDFFLTLTEERSVSRAAERRGMSQPSASRALKQLQQLFGDPLFTRTRDGLVPTVRAQQLVQPIQETLRLLRGLVRPATVFQPAEADEEWTIATTDYIELILLPPLAVLIAQEAPKLRLQVVPLPERLPLRPLEAGEIDLAIGYFPDAPASLYRQELFEETFVSVVGAPGLQAGESLTVDRFVTQRHLLVAPWRGMAGLIDPILERQGLRRTITITTTRFLTAPLVAARAPYLVTMPRSLAQAYAKYLPLTLYELPFALPRFTVTQLWHARTHHNPLHRWCRKQVVAAAATVGVRG